MTPDVGMADNGVIAVSVTAVIVRPKIVAIRRVAIAVTSLAIGWGVALAIPGVAIALIRINYCASRDRSCCKP